MNLMRGVKMSIDIAKGCEFLEQNKMVHRDIAARNCLVTTLDDSEANTSNILVKIGDFGLAREIYVCDYYQQGGNRLLPIRWMSPEAIFDGLFTTQSDIWCVTYKCLNCILFQIVYIRFDCKVIWYIALGDYYIGTPAISRHG